MLLSMKKVMATVKMRLLNTSNASSRWPDALEHPAGLKQLSTTFLTGIVNPKGRPEAMLHDH